MTAIADPLEAYFRTVTDVDEAEATRVVLTLLDEGTPLERITAEVLGAAQVRVGRLWEQGRWSVADEHAATAVTETALSALAAAARRRPSQQRRHVLLACAQGEWHTLPARMAATLAGTHDVRVTVAGPSMPADQLGRRLSAGDVDVLALSCTLPTNLLGAAHCVRAAHEAGVPVVAGGRAFGDTPRRALAIGADGWSARPAALATMPLAISGRDPRITPEMVLLDTVDDATVLAAYDLLVRAVPGLGAASAYEQGRTRESLRWMARFAGASVLVDDASILDDCFAWLGRVLDGRVPEPVAATAAHVVADRVQHFAPSGASALRQAADRLRNVSGNKG